MSYSDYVHKNILDKLGMTSTSVDPSRKDVKFNVFDKKAFGYKKSTTGFDKQTNYTGILYPSGCALGTIDDLSKLANALTPNPSIKCPLFEKNETLYEFLKTSSATARNGIGMAHGKWEELYTNGTRGVEHAGFSPGYSAMISILPELGWNFVAVANIDGDKLLTLLLHRRLWGLYRPLNNTQISDQIEGII